MLILRSREAVIPIKENVSQIIFEMNDIAVILLNEVILLAPNNNNSRKIVSKSIEMSTTAFIKILIFIIPFNISGKSISGIKMAIAIIKDVFPLGRVNNKR